MAGDGLALHALDGVRQAVRCGVEVRVVDLPDVAAHHDLGAVAHAADDGLHLVRAEVLRLVDDHELVRDAAAADVGERLHHQLAGGHQLVHPLLRALAVGIALRAAGAGREQVADVVEDRLHPHGELLVLVAGQVADVATERHDGPRHQQLVEALLLDDLLHARGDRHERLARARGADERDQLDVVVEQQVERHRLLHVACHHAVDGLARPGDGDQVPGVAEDARQAGMARVGLVHQDHELVGNQRIHVELLAVRRAGIEPGERRARELSLLVQRVDQVVRHLHRAVPRVQPVRIHAVGLEVLAGDAQRIALDARVDVLGDEDGAQPARLQPGGHAQDQVVVLVELQPALAGHRLHACHADHASLLVPADALEEVPEAPELVERADHLARVAARLVVVLLELVQLLDHRERDDDLVLLELEDRLRVVQQHVRVEHEMLLRCSRSLGGGLLGASGLGRVAGGVTGQRAILWMSGPGAPRVLSGQGAGAFGPHPCGPHCGGEGCGIRRSPSRGFRTIERYSCRSWPASPHAAPVRRPLRPAPAARCARPPASRPPSVRLPWRWSPWPPRGWPSPGTTWASSSATAPHRAAACWWPSTGPPRCSRRRSRCASTPSSATTRPSSTR